MHHWIPSKLAADPVDTGDDPLRQLNLRTRGDRHQRSVQVVREEGRDAPYVAAVT